MKIDDAQNVLKCSICRCYDRSPMSRGRTSSKGDIEISHRIFLTSNTTAQRLGYYFAFIFQDQHDLIHKSRKDSDAGH